MTFANGLLVVIFLILLIFNKKVKITALDGFFYVIGPYVAIIFLNNLYWVNMGFYQIKDYAIFVHIYAMAIFFAGTILSYFVSKKVHVTVGRINYTQIDVDMKKVKILSAVCHAIVIIDLLYRFRKYGITALVSDSGDFNTGFLAGHAQCLLVPLTIILVNNLMNLEKKDKSSLVMAAISMLCIASSFVKYHIMSTIIAVFVYCAIKNPKKIRRLGIIIGILIVTFFVVIYTLDFAARGEFVDNIFYINHFWKYVAGGVINIDALNMQYANNHDISVWIWLFVNIMAFPNMFILNLFGTKIPNYSAFKIPLFPVGNMMELSNVASIITSIYVQSNIIEFVIVVFLWGFVVEWARNRSYTTKNECSRIILSIFLAFNVLSFFSSMFVLSAPWEMMLMTYVVFLFARDRKSNYAKNSI